MDKIDIIKRIADSHFLPESRSEMIINIIIEKIIDRLKREGEIKIEKFGTFSVKAQSKYPTSFSETTIFAKKEVTFAPDYNYLETINT